MKKDKKRKLFADFEGSQLEDWRNQVSQDLKGKPIEKLNWQTDEGFEVPPFFTAEELDPKTTGINSLPGELPFRRGNAFNSNTANWQIVQEISVDNSPETLSRIQEARQADIHAFKLYSWQGGAKKAQFAPIIDSLDLNKEALHLYASYEPLALVKGINATLAKQKLDPSRLTGTLTSLSIDTGRAKPDDILQEMEEAEHFRCLGIDMSVVDENGGTLVHQLAFALSRTVDWVSQSALPAQRVLSALNFTFPTGSDFMMEIAKMRAFRMLFSFVAEQLGGKGAALSPFILAQSARWNKSRYDAHTNLLRTTTEAISAAMGGAHAITVSAFDKLLGPENAFSTRLARNIQHILKHESYLDKVADPAGGSYYIEHLTQKLITEAWACFQEIEEAGGYAVSLHSGHIDQLLIDSQLKKQGDIAKRKRVFIGVNEFPNADERLGNSDQSMHIGDEGPASFERLRLKTDQWSLANERRPQAFLLAFGDPRMRQARVQFSSNLLHTCGIQIHNPNSGGDFNSSLAALKKTEVDMIVLCAADTDYHQELITQIRQLKNEVPIIIAGKIQNQIKSDFNIYAGMDAIAFIEALQDRILI